MLLTAVLKTEITEKYVGLDHFYFLINCIFGTRMNKLQ